MPRYGGRTSDEWGARVNFTLRLAPRLKEEVRRFAEQDGYISVGDWIHDTLANEIVHRQQCEADRLAEIIE